MKVDMLVYVNDLY